MRKRDAFTVAKPTEPETMIAILRAAPIEVLAQVAHERAEEITALTDLRYRVEMVPPGCDRPYWQALLMDSKCGDPGGWLKFRECGMDAVSALRRLDEKVMTHTWLTEQQKAEMMPAINRAMLAVGRPTTGI